MKYMQIIAETPKKTINPLFFKKLQIEVGEIIFNKIYNPPEKRAPKIPTKFFIFHDLQEQRIVCRWCGNCRTLREDWYATDQPFMTVNRPDLGYNLEEWDNITNQYIQFKRDMKAFLKKEQQDNKVEE